MIINHLGKSPIIDESAFVALTATICGDVKIGKNSRIMYGAVVIAEGGSIEIGDNYCNRSSNFSWIKTMQRF